MKIVEKNPPPPPKDIEIFLSNIDFKLPEDFMEFFKEANGAIITGDEKYADLWPLTEMIQLNDDYKVNEYAPNFFLFGSDGGDIALAIEKTTGDIFEIPFIGMSNAEAIFKAKNFNEVV